MDIIMHMEKEENRERREGEREKYTTDVTVIFYTERGREE